MRLSVKQRKFSLMVGEFLCEIYEMGLEVTIGYTFRSEREQRYLISRGRSQVLYSKHRQKLAIDLNLFIYGRYETRGELYRALGELWESKGGRWGGRFGVKKKDYDKKVGWDANHFEYKG